MTVSEAILKALDKHFGYDSNTPHSFHELNFVKIVTDYLATEYLVSPLGQAQGLADLGFILDEAANLLDN